MCVRTVRIVTLVICMVMLSVVWVFAASSAAEIRVDGVKAASYNYSKIRVSWDTVEDADGYIVYRASSENGTYRKSYTTDNPKKNLLTERKSSQNTPSQSVLMPDREQ